MIQLLTMREDMRTQSVGPLINNSTELCIPLSHNPDPMDVTGKLLENSMESDFLYTVL